MKDDEKVVKCENLLTSSVHMEFEDEDDSSNHRCNWKPIQISSEVHKIHRYETPGAEFQLRRSVWEERTS
jgi:hypothetical protein